jgi:hypothetical protein
LGNKSEKRLARNALRQAKEAEKKPLAIKNILAARKPHQTVAPEVKRVPVSYKPGESRFPHMMLYEKDLEDRNGSWSWGSERDWHPTPGNAAIYGYLDAYKNKTWAEIDAEMVGKKNASKKNDQRNKSYPLSAICSEAFERIVHLELDDQETIFRFRMSGEERLYGFIFGITFKTVWYDELHLVCPMTD